MNEAGSGHAVPDGMHDDGSIRAAQAQTDFHFWRKAGRSGAATLAGTIAALMLAGCPTTGGGGGGDASVGTIGAAMSAKNIEARNEMLAQRRQEQIAMADARQLQRQQQKLEAQRAVQAASDRLALQQAEQQAKIQQEQQQKQQQGNQGKMIGRGQGNQGQGRDHIPPGQAKKQ
jgi:hypothetical protein